MDSNPTWEEIKERLQFVPPFFEPAADHPQVLSHLWEQTKSAYLDNPLPALFKEKLAALLGRYCEVPYCLVCHTCSLRPLGMGGAAIVALLTERPHTDFEVLEAAERVATLENAIDFSGLTRRTEQDLLTLGSAVYFGGAMGSRARMSLRSRLSAGAYQNFVLFVAYNRMCHDWMAAHPEVSYALDERYVQHYPAIAAESPRIGEVITQSGAPVAAPDAHEAIAEKRAEEAQRSVDIMDRRFHEVLGNLNASIASATKHASESEDVVHELRRTASFAQELLAIVSHDLRNPLNVVLMGVQLVASSFPDNEKVTKPLARVVSAARRAERMIHDLLDFSQARAGGGIPIRLAVGNVHEHVRIAVEESVHAERIRVTHEGDGTAEFDPDRLTQVISNLLSNAAHHGRSDVLIELLTKGEGDRIVLEVRNANLDGPIPDDLIPVLFDPFKRGVAKAISRTRSIGLGLYIVDQIVRGHRGRVEVASSRSSGTTSFVVELPRTSSAPGVSSRISLAP